MSLPVKVLSHDSERQGFNTPFNKSGMRFFDLHIKSVADSVTELVLVSRKRMMNTLNRQNSAWEGVCVFELRKEQFIVMHVMYTRKKENYSLIFFFKW